MHETQCGPPRVHRMNRKAWFEVLTRWRSKNDEERRRTVETFAKFLTETFRKRLGLDFLHGNDFPKQIRKREKCLRGWTPFFFTSSPIYSKISRRPSGLRKTSPNSNSLVNRKSRLETLFSKLIANVVGFAARLKFLIFHFPAILLAATNFIESWIFSE